MSNQSPKKEAKLHPESSNPAFSWVTDEDRAKHPELRHVESIRIFTTKNGVVLTCLTTSKTLSEFP